MKLDKLIGLYKAMDMKGTMDVLNTLFHMSTLPQGLKEAASALKQVGKGRSLLPH